MFCRLKDNFLLRGWERLPYALVNSQTGGVSFLNAETWDALTLCDGTVDVSLPVIPAKIRSIIAEAERQGLIEKCESGHGLTEIQKYRKYPARYIKQAHWSITGRCNYRCKHCFMSAPSAKFGEMTHAQIMDIVNQLADCGVMNVSLTGGEPLIRDDFMEIVDALLECGIHIRTIYSNGALVNEKLLRELDARNIHPEFNMSYDGKGWHGRTARRKALVTRNQRSRRGSRPGICTLQGLRLPNRSRDVHSPAQQTHPQRKHPAHGQLRCQKRKD